jgi:hypothetical protein
MTDMMYIRNNSESPLFLTPKVGGERVRLEVGWNKVPSGYIERGTGGFKGTGVAMRAKGGAFAHLFNDHIKVGKRMAPVLQIGTPVDGDEVHVVAVRPGLRSHYRTRDAETRTQRELEQERKLASQEARIEMLTQQLEKLVGRQVGDQAPLSEGIPDITGLEVDDIKAAIKDLDATSIKQMLGAEVAGDARQPVVKLLKSAIKKSAKK